MLHDPDFIAAVDSLCDLILHSGATRVERRGQSRSQFRRTLLRDILTQLKGATAKPAAEGDVPSAHAEQTGDTAPGADAASADPINTKSLATALGLDRVPAGKAGSIAAASEEVDITASQPAADAAHKLSPATPAADASSTITGAGAGGSVASTPASTGKGGGGRNRGPRAHHAPRGNGGNRDHGSVSSGTHHSSYSPLHASVYESPSAPAPGYAFVSDPSVAMASWRPVVSPHGGMQAQMSMAAMQPMGMMQVSAPGGTMMGYAHMGPAPGLWQQQQQQSTGGYVYNASSAPPGTVYMTMPSAVTAGTTTYAPAHPQPYGQW